MEKITFIKRDTTDKEGNALKTRDGRPYTRLSLKVESKGDRYISGFGSKDNADWKVGDDVELIITESQTTDKNGNPYLNFTVPKKEDRVLDNTEMILNRLVGISLKLEQILSHVIPASKARAEVEDYPDEPNPDDVPF